MVTILLATYNGGKYLAKQLDSLLRQTYRDIEIVIRDDCSADATRSIIANYIQKYPEKIRFVHSDSPSGSAKNNFFSLLKTDDLRGDYFMLCDQDDFWLPDKVELTLALMEVTQAKYPEKPVLVHTDLIVADSELNEKAPSFIHYQDLHPSRCSLNYLLVQNNITGCTMMFNRRLLELAADIKDTSDIMMHDWWMGLIASALGKVEFLEIPTILYRQHGGNDVGAIDVFSRAYFIKQLRRVFKPGSGPLEASLQARTFESCFKHLLSDSQREMVDDFAMLMEFGRIKRLRVTLKYRLFMQSRFRSIMHLIYNVLFRKRIGD